MFDRVFVSRLNAKRSVRAEAHQLAVGRQGPKHREVALQFGLEPRLHRLRRPQSIVLKRSGGGNHVIEDRQDRLRISTINWLDYDLHGARLAWDTRVGAT